MREPHKAVDLLVEAARGIASEHFLATKIVPTDEECTEERLQIIYFLKVSQPLDFRLSIKNLRHI